MSQAPKGSIGWVDLTVENAEEVRDFYQQVVGWDYDAVHMGDYSDFNMMPRGTETPIAGICHSRGGNAEMPASWMLYITVPDMAEAVEKVTKLGGEVLVGPKGEKALFCVIRDPAGAVCALFQDA